MLFLLKITANVKCLKFIVFIFLPFHLLSLSLTVDTIMSTVIIIIIIIIFIIIIIVVVIIIVVIIIIVVVVVDYIHSIITAVIITNK